MSTNASEPFVDLVATPTNAAGHKKGLSNHYFSSPATSASAQVDTLPTSTLVLGCPEGQDVDTEPKESPLLPKPIESMLTVLDGRSNRSKVPITCNNGNETWRVKSNSNSSATEVSATSDRVSDYAKRCSQVCRIESQFVVGHQARTDVRLAAGTDNRLLGPNNGNELQPNTTDEVLQATQIVTDSIRSREVVDELLNEHTVVSLDCKGPDGEIALILVASCTGQCYIFDMYVCPKMMIDGRLRDLIENKNVVKVMHNCHESSMLLYKEYRVKLTNVFDTQCAFNIIEAQHNAGSASINKLDSPVCRNLVSSIYGRCLVNLTEAAMQRLQKQNPKFWAVRPLSDKVIDYVAREVLCLVPEAHQTMLAALKPAMRPLLDRISLLMLEPLTVDSNENSLEPAVVELCHLWKQVVEKVLILTVGDGADEDSGYYPSSETNQELMETPPTSIEDATASTCSTASTDMDGDEEDNISPNMIGGRRNVSKRTTAERDSLSSTDHSNSAVTRLILKPPVKRKADPNDPIPTSANFPTSNWSSSDSDVIHKPKKMKRSYSKQRASAARSKDSSTTDSKSEDGQSSSQSSQLVTSTSNSSAESVSEKLWAFMPAATQSMPHLVQNGNQSPTGKVVREVRPGMHCVHLSFEDLTSSNDMSEDEEYDDQEDVKETASEETISSRDSQLTGESG